MPGIYDMRFRNLNYFFSIFFSKPEFRNQVLVSQIWYLHDINICMIFFIYFLYYYFISSLLCFYCFYSNRNNSIPIKDYHYIYRFSYSDHARREPDFESYQSKTKLNCNCTRLLQRFIDPKRNSVQCQYNPKLFNWTRFGISSSDISDMIYLKKTNKKKKVS